MSDETAARARIVAEAKLFVGTPYRSNTGVLHVGVDCGYLLREVFVRAGLIETFAIAPYPMDRHLHCAEGDEQYLGYVEAHLKRIEMSALGPGDVLVFKVGKVYSHGGIVTGINPIFLVHAHMRVGCVAEDRMRKGMGFLQPQYEPRAYSFWGAA